MQLTLKTISQLLHSTLTLLMLLIALPTPSYAYFACAAQKFDTFEFLTTIDDHILSLRSKDISKAYYAYTSIDFRKNTSLEEFQNLVKKYPALHNNQAIALDTIYFNENIGCYQGIATSKEGEQLIVKFLLKEESGKWKIASLQLFEHLCRKDKNVRNKGCNSYFNTVTSG